MLLIEEQQGVRFDIITTHEAEDLIYSDWLSLQQNVPFGKLEPEAISRPSTLAPSRSREALESTALQGCCRLFVAGSELPFLRNARRITDMPLARDPLPSGQPNSRNWRTSHCRNNTPLRYTRVLRIT